MQYVSICIIDILTYVLDFRWDDIRFFEEFQGEWNFRGRAAPVWRREMMAKKNGNTCVLPFGEFSERESVFPSPTEDYLAAAAAAAS